MSNISMLHPTLSMMDGRHVGDGRRERESEWSDITARHCLEDGVFLLPHGLEVEDAKCECVCGQRNERAHTTPLA